MSVVADLQNLNTPKYTIKINNNITLVSIFKNPFTIKFTVYMKIYVHS